MSLDRFSRVIKAAAGIAGKSEPAARSWYSFRAQEDKPEEVDLYIYDEISYYGVTAQDFVKDLAAVKASVIHNHINTPGGFVFDGMAIYNALMEHPAKVITHIDGLAASMGSVIALAGDEVRIAKTAFVMIHNPWSWAIGSAADLRKEADVLDKLGATIRDVYAARTKKTPAECQALMDEETWWSGDEAVAHGFADSVVNAREDDEAAKALAGFDLTIFAKAPKSLLAMAGAGSQAPDAAPPTKRQVEQALRDAGLSRAQAKAFVAKAYDEVASSRRDAAEEDWAAVAEMLRRNIAILTTA